MSADNVVSLAAHRRNHAPSKACQCDPINEVQCYPHQLAALAAHIRTERAEVEWLQIATLGTYRRLGDEVLAVLDRIADECLPNERTAE